MRVIDRGEQGIVRPVLWTRGQGCNELATVLSEVEPVRVVGDVTEACIRNGAELLVSRRLSANFDLVSSAVPVDFDVSGISSVVAAVAGGPHSELAVLVAVRIGAMAGVESIVTAAFEHESDRGRALTAIERLAEQVPGVEYRLVQAAGVSDLVKQLPPKPLLVIGAPGGGWLQRTYFGPGAKLRAEAPGGAVVVRRGPDRVFQVMSDPVFVGPLREAVDILRLHQDQVLAVVDRARLIGIVRREVLELADPGVPVEAFMEAPISVAMTASVDDAREIEASFHGGSIPVVDENGRLVGALPTRSTR